MKNYHHNILPSRINQLVTKNTKSDSDLSTDANDVSAEPTCSAESAVYYACSDKVT